MKNNLLETIQSIVEVITKDKDYKDKYYTDVQVTLYDQEEDENGYNGYNTKELIYGDPKNPYIISIFKIIEEGCLCDGMPDDIDYGFHDPYEPIKNVLYIIKGLDRQITLAIEDQLNNV